MAANWANALPIDERNTPLQDFPAPVKAQARYVRDPIASSVITLTDNTTTLEVGAIGGGGVLLRWVPATETAAGAPFGSVIASGVGANYDHWIPPNMVRRFVVPKETSGVSSIVGTNIANGLYNRVAWIAANVPGSSIIAAEY